MTPDRPSIEAEIDEFGRIYGTWTSTEYDSDAEEQEARNRAAAAREALLSRFLEQQRDSERLESLAENTSRIVCHEVGPLFRGRRPRVEFQAKKGHVGMSPEFLRSLADGLIRSRESCGAAIQPEGTPQK